MHVYVGLSRFLIIWVAAVQVDLFVVVAFSNAAVDKAGPDVLLVIRRPTTKSNSTMGGMTAYSGSEGSRHRRMNEGYTPTRPPRRASQLSILYETRSLVELFLLPLLSPLLLSSLS